LVASTGAKPTRYISDDINMPVIVEEADRAFCSDVNDDEVRPDVASWDVEIRSNRAGLASWPHCHISSRGWTNCSNIERYRGYARGRNAAHT
jgi:hypothetical protein